MPPPLIDKAEQDTGNQVFPASVNLTENSIEKQCKPGKYQSRHDRPDEIRLHKKVSLSMPSGCLDKDT